MRTDPWRYDPAVGAKESIIADVLEALEAKLELVTPDVENNAKSALRGLAKRVDWSKAIQLAAKTGLALQLPRLEDLTELIKESPDNGDETGATRGLAGFREQFVLLMASDELKHVQRVSVLVDDLDRCLSRTVVESLEAIRLFLSVPKMATSPDRRLPSPTITVQRAAAGSAYGTIDPPKGNLNRHGQCVMPSPPRPQRWCGPPAQRPSHQGSLIRTVTQTL